MPRIVDFNNMFSSSGGGVRTYHLKKLDFFSRRDDFDYTLIIPSAENSTEKHGNARIIYLKSPSIPGTVNYRMFLNPFRLESILRDLDPDLIETGGPYVDPFLIRYASRNLDAVITGFWHTHYPDAYLKSIGNAVSRRTGDFLQKLGWKAARKTYGWYDATFAASDCIINQLLDEDIGRIIQIPLGVDTDLFCPEKRSTELRRSVDDENRKLVFFPHRLLKEKGILEVVEAVPRILKEVDAVFVFAGTGPELPHVEDLCDRIPGCHYIGFIDSEIEMARWYASSDMIYGLSAWETFGFSIIEAMASGVPLVVADRGAANDWVTRAGCGLSIAHGDVDAVVDASVSLLKRSDLARMGMRGRRYVVRNLSWEITFSRMVEYYTRLINAHKSGRSLDGYPRLFRETAASGVIDETCMVF